MSSRLLVSRVAWHTTLLLSAALSGCDFETTLKYEFVPGGHAMRKTSWLVADSNKDGDEEVFALDAHTGEVFIDKAPQSGVQMWIDREHLRSLAGVIHLQEGGKLPALAINRVEADRESWLDLYDIEDFSVGRNPCRIRELRHPAFRNHGIDFRSEPEPKPWTCELLFSPSVLFLDDDSFEDPILLASTGYELIPRGVWIFDGESLSTDGRAEVLWHRATMGRPGTPIVERFGQPEHENEGVAGLF